jgi:translation elongation factor EF-Tu-like GTPase/cold shock CspA family protein
MQSKSTFYNSLILSVLLATFVSLGFTPAAPLEQSAGLASGGSESVTAVSEDNRTLGEIEPARSAAEPQGLIEEPFLMQIEGVFSIRGRGTVVTGRVARGTAQPGDQVEIIGSDDEIRKTVIKGVEMSKKTSDQVEAGDNVAILLQGIDRDEVEHGMVLAEPGSMATYDEALSELESARSAAEPQGLIEQPFLMLIEGVFSIKGVGTVVTGRVARGTAQPGDPVEIIGFDVEIRKTVMTNVEMFKKISDQVEAGDNVGIVLRGIDRDEVEPGMVLAEPGSMATYDEALSELEAAAEPQEPDKEPFLMLMEGVFSIKGVGTVVTGRVARGTAQAGDEVEIIGLDDEIRKTEITAVEVFFKTLDQVEAGDHVGILLRGIDRDEVEPGMVLAEPGSMATYDEALNELEAAEPAAEPQEPNAGDPFENNGPRYAGTVKWFSPAVGYGFIQPDAEDNKEADDVFVHHSAIVGRIVDGTFEAMVGFKNLEEGERVKFGIEVGRKGLEAVDVVVLEE